MKRDACAYIALFHLVTLSNYLIISKIFNNIKCHIYCTKRKDIGLSNQIKLDIFQHRTFNLQRRVSGTEVEAVTRRRVLEAREAARDQRRLDLSTPASTMWE